MMADELECLELAAHLLNMENKYEDWDEVWDTLYDLHGIDEDGFCWLVNKLLPLIKIGGMLPDEPMYKGFAKHLGGDLGLYLAKTDFGMTRSEYIEHIAYGWAYEKVKDCENCFEVTITKNGKEPILLTVCKNKREMEAI